jgi:hypothetical protein
MKQSFFLKKGGQISTRFIPDIPVLAIPFSSGVLRAGIFTPLPPAKNGEFQCVEVQYYVIFRMLQSPELSDRCALQHLISNAKGSR